MSEKVLYEKSPGWKRMILSYALWILIVMTLYVVFIDDWHNQSPVIYAFWVAVLLYDLWHTLASSAFRIMEDRVEFYTIFSRKLKWALPMLQVKQIRYEDGFQTVFGGPYLLLYPMDPSVVSGKPTDRIHLRVKNTLSYRKDIAAIIMAFTEAGVDVNVRTSSKKLIRLASLEQWQEVGRKPA